MHHEMLEAIFVQRQELAADTVARVRESVLNGNKHYMLFVGPRGCGKTHFVSLIYHRLKTIDDLGDKLRVAWLNEDKTSTTVLDLNRRIYETLNKHYPDEFPADQLNVIYDQDPAEASAYLQELLNDRLADKSALVIIENLDAMFRNLGRAGQHEWRSFLQESGKFTVLATAQQLFPGVSDRNLPFYGSFQTSYFKPLSVPEGIDLLKNIAEQQEDKELAAFLATPEGRSRVRTLHHLSGGNHRVYVVFSEFINRKSLDELVTPFEETLDELTPYYQERLRWLTPQQRMIVEHLCTSDRALPVKEIARSLFATNQTISKQLKELKQKRYVRSAQRGRESLYELTEPLMRLAMELKENRGGPVRLIVDFLRVWYSRKELQNRLRLLSDTERMERIHVESAIEKLESGEENLRIHTLRSDIEHLADQGDEAGVREAVEELTVELIGSTDDKLRQAGLLMKLASQLYRWEQHVTALDVINEAVELAPEDASVHSERGYILSALRRYEEALAEHDKAIEQDPTNTSRRPARGVVLCSLERFQEAVSEFDVVLEENADSVFAWDWKARALSNLRRFDDALAAIDEAIKREDERSSFWFVRGWILKEAGRLAEAVDAYSKGIEINPDDAACFNNRAVALYTLGRNDEALESVAESLCLRPNDATTSFTRVEIMLSSGHWERGWLEIEKCLQQFPPQTEPSNSAQFVIQVIFRSTQRQELWTERIAKLCDIFDGADALAYVGEGLVRTLRFSEIEQASSEVLSRWQAAWHQVGDQYDELSFSLRLFDAGIEFLKTREPNELLDLPVEQRAILEQLFDIDVAHDE